MMMPRNKLTAIMFLFMAASPIGPLIRIFMLVFNYLQSMNGDNSSYLREVFTALLEGPKPMFPIPDDGHNVDGGIPGGIASIFYTGIKRNITADDIMRTVFHHHAMPIHSLYSMNHPRSAEHLNQDLKMVLPWIFAFTAIIIFPLSLVVLNALWRRGDMETSYRLKKSMIFQLCLQGYQKDITGEDIISQKKTCDENNADIGSADDDDDSDDDFGYDEPLITLPKAGVAINSSLALTKNQLREVPGTCAICLSSYKQGETVVWSSYGQCRHVFHKQCIVTWIKKNFTSSCPCCRRDFIDPGLYSRMKHDQHIKSKIKAS
jgi:hypothetical protein